MKYIFACYIFYRHFACPIKAIKCFILRVFTLSLTVQVREYTVQTQGFLRWIERRSSRTTEDNSSGRIMRLVLVFTQDTNNQTNNECLPAFVQTDMMRPLV